MSVFSFRRDGLVINQESVQHSLGSTQQQQQQQQQVEEEEESVEQQQRVSRERRLGSNAVEKGDVLLAFAPDQQHTVAHKLRRSLWTYVYPGWWSLLGILTLHVTGL